MGVANQIQESVERLPVSFQQEVLDFVEYLLAKAEREELRREEREWTSFSLASALRDADEDEPLYSRTDLTVVF